MKKPKLDDVVTVFKDTGNCVIDCNAVVALWGRLWILSQWKDEFRLIKFLRRDSPNTRIKISISNEQASDLISRLSLTCTQGSYAHGKTWRLPEHS